MSRFADIFALQGAGMVASPSNLIVNERIKESQIRATRYRMVEILAASGFEAKQASDIADAILESLDHRGMIIENDLVPRLTRKGIHQEVARLIANNIRKAL